VYNTGHAEQNLRLIKLLLDLGVPAGARNNLGQTALHLAMKLQPPTQNISFGSKTLLDEIMRTKISELLDAEDNEGIRPIHIAAKISESLVAKLIDCGVDATALTNEDMSVLHIASRARQSNSIGHLLDHFARLGRVDMLHLRDKNGHSALHHACRVSVPFLYSPPYD
jgi:ankyrin repeat protein